jgi:hypothetical protein
MQSLRVSTPATIAVFARVSPPEPSSFFFFFFFFFLSM